MKLYHTNEKVTTVHFLNKKDSYRKLKTVTLLSTVGSNCNLLQFIADLLFLLCACTVFLCVFESTHQCVYSFHHFLVFFILFIKLCFVILTFSFEPLTSNSKRTQGEVSSELHTFTYGGSGGIALSGFY